MQYRPRRQTSDISVRIIMKDFDAVATVRNVTASGLQIRGQLEGEVGDGVTVALRDRSFRGKVVWLNDAAAGVVFDTLLRPPDLAVFTGKRMREPSGSGHHGTFGSANSIRR